MTVELLQIETAFGPVVASLTSRGLAALSFARVRSGPSSVASRARNDLERVASRQLKRYFRTGQWKFDVALDLSSGTEFDLKVWRALRRIRPGTVRTYGEVARAIGKPGSARAVGNACGRNPLPVVVPCHRVVAASGPGGFGLGLALKRRLLELEGVHA